MKANMNITITNVENASELDQFTPVTGEWSLHCDSEDRSRSGVEESVRNWMDASYKIDVQIFHADGRAIQDDVPANGTFVAMRA